MFKSIIKNTVTIIVTYGIMNLANYLGNLVTGHFKNTSAIYLVYTIVYILVALVPGIIYAKVFLGMNPRDIGVKTSFPKLKWWIIAIALPTLVVLFYLIFTEGKITKAGFLNVPSVVFCICVGVSAGVVEEFLFRGILFQYMKKTLAFLPAILIPSILFAAIHVRNLSHLSVRNVAILLAAGTLVSILFSLIAWDAGSIWPGIVVHTFWNMVIIGRIIGISGNGFQNQAIFRYRFNSNSILLTGGEFGIEAALPAIIIYILASIIIIWKKRKTHD